MKFLKLIAALTLLPLSAPQTAIASDNGVERGDVTFGSSPSIPKGVENHIESVMFANCDLRGASRISPTYLKVDQDNAVVSPNSFDYQIQYTVEFKNGAPSEMISVHAVLHLESKPNAAVEIVEFKSPICRSIP